MLMEMMGKLFGWIRIAWCAEGSGGGPKRIQNLGSRDFPKGTLKRRDSKGNASENGKVKPPEDLSAWVARWADRTGCQVAVPNTGGSRWVGENKCSMRDFD